MQAMKVELEIEPEQIRTLESDAKGRINLGVGNANKTIRVAVIETEDRAEAELED